MFLKTLTSDAYKTNCDYMFNRYLFIFEIKAYEKPCIQLSYIFTNKKICYQNYFE